MTEHDPFTALDRDARDAARGLREHVLERLDVDASLAGLPTEARRGGRGRIVAMAAAAVLLVGSVAVLNQGDDPTGRVDLDVALPDLEPGLLRPLGPRDGKDSIQLPLTAEPSTGLRDGDRVTVSAEGFVPGESVGLVQCAREAGGDAPEARGGIDGCYITDYVSLTADDSGVATGVYRVRRLLTTPLTGTVDCAAEANRCVVAMGAISDYDRSGGHGIEFAPGEPVDLPTVEVSPTQGLADGDVVHVRADGLEPDSAAYLEICSSDPVSCWYTGETFEVEHDEGRDGYTEQVIGLQVDQDGRLEGDVPVWRFLPGPDPGTYVDCALSRCSLRISGSLAPPTVPLRFDNTDATPPAPTIAVDPSDGLAAADEVVVRGAGFEPGAEVIVMACANPAQDESMAGGGCSGENPTEVEEDGTFRTTFTIPALTAGMVGIPCTPDGRCEEPQGSSEPISCDGGRYTCTISVDRYYSEEPVVGPPIFQAPPVTITYR